jgi:hypothetical protein
VCTCVHGKKGEKRKSEERQVERQRDWLIPGNVTKPSSGRIWEIRQADFQVYYAGGAK